LPRATQASLSEFVSIATRLALENPWGLAMLVSLGRKILAAADYVAS
jgi:hypothetical protein